MFDAKNSFSEKIPDSSSSPVGEKQTQRNTRARPPPSVPHSDVFSHTHTNTAVDFLFLFSVKFSPQLKITVPVLFCLFFGSKLKVQIRLWGISRFPFKILLIQVRLRFQPLTRFAVISLAQIKGAIRHEKHERLLKPGRPF